MNSIKPDFIKSGFLNKNPIDSGFRICLSQVRDEGDYESHVLWLYPNQKMAADHLLIILKVV